MSAQPAPAPIPRVQVVEPSGNRRSPIDLTSSGLTIGRVEGNDIVLPDNMISRQHARIDWDGTRATVTDLGSSNGTAVGDARLLPHAAHEWPPDDWINVGPYFIRIDLPRQSAPPPIRPEPIAQPTGPGPDATTNPIPVQPAKPAESGRIKVVLEQNTLTITPGQPAVIKVTLANLGTLVDHLSVSVEGVPATWVKVPDSTVQLNPGSQSIVVLQVTVARVPQNRSGEYPVTIRARSRENPDDSGAAVALWTVLPFAMVGMTIEPTRSRGRAKARHTVTIQNDSNSPQQYTLSAKDDEGVLRFGFNPPTVALEPAEAGPVRLTVESSRRWVGNAQTRRFTVQSAAAGGGAPPQTANAEYVHKAYIPVWLPPLLAVAAIGGGLFLYNALKPVPKTPKIDQFSASPRTQVVGGQIEIKWEVRDAEYVTLDPEYCPGRLPPKDQCYFDATDVGNVDITLIAVNTDGNSKDNRTVQIRERDATDPTVKVQASAETINAGEEVTISWTTENTKKVSINFGGNTVEFGNEDPGVWKDKPTSTTIYTVTVDNDGKQDKRSVRVEVIPIPTATATATATATLTPTATTPPTATAPSTATSGATSPAGGATATAASMGATATAMAATTSTVGGGAPLEAQGQPIIEVVAGSADGGVLYGVAERRIYRSDDGGLTWADVGPRQLGRMVPALNDPNDVYAGDRDSCFVRTATVPLVRSTDGGRTWPDEFPVGKGVRPLLVHTANDSIVIGTDCNLVFSFDGGRTFQYIDLGDPNLEVVDAAASDPSLREFIAVTVADSFGSARLLLFDMSDESGTYQFALDFIGPAPVAWADGWIAVATQNGVVISEDGGGSWIGYQRTGLEDVTYPYDPDTIPFVPENDPNVGFSDIVIDPTGHDRMWAATKLGVYMTQNGGRSWVKIVDQPDVQSITVSIEQDLLFVTSTDGTKSYTLDGG